MPELPILDANGKLNEFARDILWAVMCYPQDGDRQEELLAAFILEKYQDHPASPEILAELAGSIPWLAAALYRSSTPSGVLAAAKKATGSAWAVGEILTTMLAVSIHHPEIPIGPSMAIDVIYEFHRDGSGRIGYRTLWDVWTKFRAVAHFYAVRRLWDLTFEDPEGLHWQDWTAADFDEYLAVAENIRQMAVTRRFLSHEETWRVPAALGLSPARIEPGPLMPEMLALFQSYRPKHSKA